MGPVVALAVDLSPCLGVRRDSDGCEPSMRHLREARSSRPIDAHIQTDPEPWRRRFVPHFLRRERLAGQVVRFGMVGALNTLVDFGLFNVLFHFVGLPLLVANSLSVAAGIANSFIWNKHWTFSAGGRARWKREVVVFVIVSVIGLLLNNAGIYVLTRLSGNMGVLALNVQKLAASVVSMTWNFLGYRLIAFRHHGSAASE